MIPFRRRRNGDASAERFVAPARHGGRHWIWGAAATILAVTAAVTYGGQDVLADQPRPGQWPSPATDERAAPILPAPRPPAGRGGYALEQTRPDGEPVSYDPCRPLHYVINLAGAPAGGERLVRNAVALVSAATGLAFVYDGTTDEPFTSNRSPVQPGRYGDRWAPALVSWSTAAENPELAGDVAGLAGSTPVGIGAERAHYVTGHVALDRDSFPDDVTGPPGRHTAIVLHELGHLVGLDHVDDESQLMYDEARATVTTFGSGDLRGLARVGAGPCYPTD